MLIGKEGIPNGSQVPERGGRVSFENQVFTVYRPRVEISQKRIGPYEGESQRKVLKSLKKKGEKRVPKLRQNLH